MTLIDLIITNLDFSKLSINVTQKQFQKTYANYSEIPIDIRNSEVFNWHMTNNSDIIYVTIK